MAAPARDRMLEVLFFAIVADANPACGSGTDAPPQAGPGAEGARKSVHGQIFAFPKNRP
jgi:hypothetical protein